MGRMSFAILIVIIGGIILALQYFNVSASYVRLIIGIVLLVGGAQMILTSLNLPSLGRQTDSQAFFMASQFHFPNPQNSNTFTTIFANSSLDLNHIDISRGDITLTINNNFGSTQVIVNPEMPLEVRANNALMADIIGPDGGNLSGSAIKNYSPVNVQARPSKLVLIVNAFGGSVMIAKGETRYKRK